MLDKVKSEGTDRKLTFNITYYPVFRHLKSHLKELQVILVCDEAHKKVSLEVPIIGFKNNKNLKAHLGGAALPDINEVGKWKPCGRKRPPCQFCCNMKNTSTFKRKRSNEVYEIKKDVNCNSKMIVYLIECRVCGNQYNVVPQQNFVLKLTTIKVRIVIFGKNTLSNQVRHQKRFHEHYLQNDHNGICDREITVIDHTETVKSLRQKELYWYHKLTAYAPYGLHELDVYPAY